MHLVPYPFNNAEDKDDPNYLDADHMRKRMDKFISLRSSGVDGNKKLDLFKAVQPVFGTQKADYQTR